MNNNLNIPTIFRIGFVLCFIGVVYCFIHLYVSIDRIDTYVHNELHTEKEQANPTQPSEAQPATDISPHIDLKRKLESEAGTKLLRISKLIIRDEGKRNTPYLDGNK